LKNRKVIPWENWVPQFSDKPKWSLYFTSIHPSASGLPRRESDLCLGEPARGDGWIVSLVIAR
jgi:hypothetical protein